MDARLHACQIPLAKVAVIFAVGISLGNTLNLDHSSASSMLISLLVVALAWYYVSTYRYQVALVYVIVLLAGMIVFQLESLNRISLVLPSEIIASMPTVTMEVEQIRPYTKSVALVGTIKELNSQKVRTAKVIAFGSKEDPLLSDIQLGQWVSYATPLQIISDAKEEPFAEYNSYLLDQGIVYRTWVSEGGYSMSTEVPALWKTIRYKYREQALGVLNQYLEGQALAITKALLLGDKTGIRPETRKMYAESGIIHVLAVSGLHVGFLVGFLIWFWNKFFFFSSPYSWARAITIGMILLAYVEMSGGAAPVRRSVIMAILYLIAVAWRRRYVALNLWGVAAMILLILAPHDLFSVSFQLSFTAVGGIIVLYPYLSQLYNPPAGLLSRVWDIFCMGVAAQLATMPVVLYHFNQMPIYSSLAGIVAIPMTAVCLWNGAAILLSGGIYEPLGRLLGRVQEVLIMGLDLVADFFASWPLSIWHGVTLWVSESLLLLMIVGMIGFYLNTRRSLVLLMASILLVAQSLIHTGVLIYQYRIHSSTEIYSKQDESTFLSY